MTKVKMLFFFTPTQSRGRVEVYDTKRSVVYAKVCHNAEDSGNISAERSTEKKNRYTSKDRILIAYHSRVLDTT